MSQMAPAKVYVRWMIRRDMPEVLAIEAGSNQPPWTEDDFLRVLRHRRCNGMVAEAGDQVVGFMLYELRQRDLLVLNFAVARTWRRRKVGCTLLERLVGKLSSHRRPRITFLLRETNLAFLLFLKAHGFRARHVYRRYFDDPAEDAYEMRYSLDDDHDPHDGWPANRIARFGTSDIP